MMEKIIIQGRLYKVKKGTSDKLRQLLKEGHDAPPIAHERGYAFNPFNEALDQITLSKHGEYLDSIFEYY